MTTRNKIDMSDALQLLEEAISICKALHGQAHNSEKPNDKVQQSRNAKRSRQLQYTAHLVDSARVAVNTQFHRFKGDVP